MDKICVVLFAFFVFSLGIAAQTPETPLDRYLETGKTIIIAKCLAVGPVNILLRANVEVEILHVIKGNETLRKITIDSQFEMRPGEIYLLRSESEAIVDKAYFRINTMDSRVVVSPYEDLKLLKTLSPRIVVLRTMNVRIDDIENQIRRLTYEIEALKAIKLNN